MRLSAAPLRCQMRWVILDLGELPCRQQIEFRAPGRVATAEAVIFLRRAQLKAALGACLVELAYRRIGRASDSQFPNSFISGDAVPTGMGGRGVSPVRCAREDQPPMKPSALRIERLLAKVEETPKPGPSKYTPWAKLGVAVAAASVCRAAAMLNGRCKVHGGKSTGPRTPEGLERSKRARWKHGYYSREAKVERSRVRAAILALRYLRMLGQ